MREEAREKAEVASLAATKKLTAMWALMACRRGLRQETTKAQSYNKVQSLWKRVP